MSSGSANDRLETESLLKQTKPALVRDNKTWLRHGQDKQSGIVDIMLFAGKYTREEIASKIRHNGALKDKLKRVNDHILHLQDGDSRGKTNGQAPHRLKIVELPDGALKFADKQT